MPIDFSKRTEQDFINFENRKAEIFQINEEQVEQQIAQYKSDMIENVKQILEKYNINFTGTETDFTQLYTLYIKGDGTKDNLSMYEWLGSEDEINNTLAYRIEYFNNLENFCSYIMTYE